MPLVVFLVPVEFEDVIKQISSAEFSRHKALKVEKFDPLFSSFIPFPFLPSVAQDDRKQFHCLNIAPK